MYIFSIVDFGSENAHYMQNESSEYYISYTLDKENIEEAYQIPDISISHTKCVNSKIDYKSHKGIDSYTEFISIDDFKDIENFIFGSMPKNENEILIRSDYEVVINHHINGFITLKQKV